MFKQMTDIFAAAAIKILSAVDANANSHQHEIGGLVKCGFGRVLGDDPTLVRRLPTHYVWMEDDEDNYFNDLNFRVAMTLDSPGGLFSS